MRRSVVAVLVLRDVRAECGVAASGVVITKDKKPVMVESCDRLFLFRRRHL